VIILTPPPLHDWEDPKVSLEGQAGWAADSVCTFWRREIFRGAAGNRTKVPRLSSLQPSGYIDYTDLATVQLCCITSRS